MWQVSCTVYDPPAAWQAAFTLRDSPEAFGLWIHISLNISPFIHQDQLAEFQKITKAYFHKYFSYRFFLSKESFKPKPLLGHLEFSAAPAGADLQLTLFPGQGNTCLDQWFLNSEPLDWVHELGHQMGLVDEYPDSASKNRASAESIQVFPDDSLMANYKDHRGQPKPGVGFRNRHGERIAALLQSSTGENWASHPPAFLHFQAGDSLTQIASRLYRNGERWLEIYELNRDRIPDRFHIRAGTRLELPAGVC